MYTSKDKEEAFRLRLEGKSYNEIRKLLGIRSKSTLGVWFKELTLTPQAASLLKRNIDLATKRKLLAFNANRSERIRLENLEARRKGSLEVGQLSKRDLFILGIALYWGEGTKSEGNSSYNSLSFSNSDPEMIEVFLKFLREIIHVPENKIRGNMHIYESIDVTTAKKFWSICTKLPIEQFTASYQVSKAGKGIRKTLPYGTLNVRVHDRRLFYRIKGMIDGMAIKSGLR
ncbi:MAG: hypothetical protein JWN90_348 [Parcubacteria group bacterium]|nr:hypothetical protein [Parcubacteria group bacterium]